MESLARRQEPATPRGRWHGVLREPTIRSTTRSRACARMARIKWRGKLVSLNRALAGEPVVLAEDADGWTVSFGPVILGSINAMK